MAVGIFIAGDRYVCGDCGEQPTQRQRRRKNQANDRFPARRSTPAGFPLQGRAICSAIGFTGLARRKDRSMPRKGITGHDEWVITQALATALVALEQLPANIQPRPHMEDLRKLLTAGCQPGTENLHLAQAKCRLFPDKDPLAVYQEYGVEGGRD
jgi:hypothetical protein